MVIFSIGCPQINYFKDLVKQNVDWVKIEMFNLDEYIGISEIHSLCFCKCLEDRFTKIVRIKQIYLINTKGKLKKYSSFN